ncbi:hypothetical protein EYF80_011793 [Liparis tanakae]|uniref:Uncharacterized protein n=1 Tax=Liparis tanakae TaxID=230148 RepID=A0A4Z2IJ84_9TELE|nr:hypothetical protein EYF80_011793 [Liparis tanakae]
MGSTHGIYPWDLPMGSSHGIYPWDLSSVPVGPLQAYFLWCAALEGSWKGPAHHSLQRSRNDHGKAEAPRAAQVSRAVPAPHPPASLVAVLDMWIESPGTVVL